MKVLYVYIRELRSLWSKHFTGNNMYMSDASHPDFEQGTAYWTIPVVDFVPRTLDNRSGESASSSQTPESSKK